MNLCTFIYRKCVSTVIGQLRCVPVKQVLVNCGFLGHVAQSRVAHRSECLPYSSSSLTEGQRWCPGPTPSGAPCRSC